MAPDHESKIAAGHQPGRAVYPLKRERSILGVLIPAHARLWAELASSGSDIGAHDRLVAATAVAAGWRVGTANTRDFERVPGLEVVAISMAS